MSSTVPSAALRDDKPAPGGSASRPGQRARGMVPCIFRSLIHMRQVYLLQPASSPRFSHPTESTTSATSKPAFLPAADRLAGRDSRRRCRFEIGGLFPEQPDLAEQIGELGLFVPVVFP